jgi:nitrogen fixation/metabolism regulation signal transduction histidine kinase
VNVPEPTRRMRRSPTGFVVNRRQVVLALYSVLIGGAFAAGVLGVMNSARARATALAMDMVADDAALQGAIDGSFQQTYPWVALLALLFVAGNVAVTVLYTHRIVGPAVAFRRHVRDLIEGRYDAKLKLRPNDDFAQLASDLNELSETMARQQQPPPAPPAA